MPFTALQLTSSFVRKMSRHIGQNYKKYFKEKKNARNLMHTGEIRLQLGDSVRL